MASDSDLGESALAVGLAILGGLAAAAILSALFKPKCPICHNLVSNGVNQCPHCGSPLQWEGGSW